MKIASTLFLFAALIAMLYVNIGQVGGVYMNINDAREEAAKKINSEALSTLTITGTDLASGRASFTGRDEIRYDGHLYDIAARTNQGDKLVLAVLHDSKEEGLLSDLKEIIESWANNPQQTSKHPTLKQIVIIKDFIPACKFNFTHNCMMEEVATGHRSDLSEAPLLAVLKSPPQFV